MTKKRFILGILTLSILIALLAIRLEYVQGQTEEKIEQIEPQKELKLESDWEMLRKAIIMVESGGDRHAVNASSGAYGLYQILPNGGYLDEYNRITGHNVTMEDLVDSEFLQHEIFDVVQRRHNPLKDFKEALFVHNPRAMSDWYMTNYEYRVMYWYHKLKHEELKRSIEADDYGLTN